MPDRVKTENIYSFDCAKIIFCICVVAIHTMGAYGPYPILRIAVPMFFCISSFLFFRKLDGNNDRVYLFKFLSRNAKLYAFWFLVLLVPTLIIGGWLKGNIVRNAIKFFLKIFLGSTFPASWYIPALMISVVVVFLFRKILPKWCLLLGTFLIYVFCCISSNYRGLIDETSVVYKLIIMYPGTIYNSFPVGFVWVAIGCFLSDGWLLVNKKTAYIGGIVSFVLLFIEHWLISLLGCCVDNDCYFMLIPVCYFLMQILLEIKIDLKPGIAKRMRDTSTIIYCLHGTVASILELYVFTGQLYFGESLMLFAITLALTGAVALALISLEHFSVFKWLKYSH